MTKYRRTTNDAMVSDNVDTEKFLNNISVEKKATLDDRVEAHYSRVFLTNVQVERT
jgi:hypothetical protein